MGNLGASAHGLYAEDVQRMAKNDLAAPGPDAVVATGKFIGDLDEGFAIALYRPRNATGPLPAVVFLPGRVAPESQYESYARALASRGFVVAVRGWYSPMESDRELAADARRIAHWLVAERLADPARIGAAGHSMGAKDAILAALEEDSLFHAVVAIDPDDNGRNSVAHGAIAKLKPALLLVGAEVAWKASSVCAPLANNYERFFENAPAGTAKLTLREADHVQVMDDPNGFGYGICRCGKADSRVVRNLARRATVQFFVEKLQGIALPAVAMGADGLYTVKSNDKLAANDKLAQATASAARPARVTRATTR
ncbi:MAG: hypothetical protein JWN44_5510 [Myxococcales bacterium]|nr:hypothetical protein [Myxococcales bacterium]